jgi:choline dehydrogenase-like flavoprotein
MSVEWTVITTSPDASFPYGGFISPVPNSKHVMGTTRMGTDPATSVVDPYGRLHDIPNVVVADSSVFVTSSGYGPTLTLVALALRAARALLDNA